MASEMAIESDVYGDDIEEIWVMVDVEKSGNLCCCACKYLGPFRSTWIASMQGGHC